MKTNLPFWPCAVAGALIWCALNLHAQTAPTITTQPASQVVTNGGTAIFSVTVSGTGPFTYQWLFNGSSCGIITTVAGNGTNGFSGDGGLATNAEFSSPVAVTMDSAGNLFIAEQNNSRVRKVSTNGIITTVAGNGTGAYSGDGGFATNASLYYPSGVAFDAIGNLYIADFENSRIRKVDTNGVITTVAGNGSATYAGDGGAATNASLYYPFGVAFDASGNLYIADYDNTRIRKVDTNGIITTVAGNGSNGFSGDGGAATNASIRLPSGVAFDASRNLYIADYGNNRIRKVDTNGIITTVAGNGSATYAGDGGAATNASLSAPNGVALDVFGNLYIADSGNERIRKVGMNGIITTVLGNGTIGYSGDGGAATSAALYYPPGVVVDSSGNLFIADDFNERIRRVVMATLSYLPTFTLTVNNITTNNIGNYSVIVSSSAGSVTSSVAVLYMPPFITVQPTNQQALAGNNPSFSVAAFGSGPLDYDWYFSGTNLIQSGTNSTLALHGVTANNAGNYTVVVTNSYGSVTSQVATLAVVPLVITVQPASQIALVGSSPSFSVGVAGAGPFGYEWYFAATNLVQSGTNNTLTLTSISTNNAGIYTVVVTNAYGSVTSQVATLTMVLPPMVTIQPSSQTNLPGTAVRFSVTVGNAGPFTYQWQFNGTNIPNNIISTVAGNGSATYAGDGGLAANASLQFPTGIAFDATGNLYIADYDNNRIRKVDTNGIITTVAGKSTVGYSGDGGAATNASLYNPYGVALDAFGNLYNADLGNNRIRRVNTNGIITTVAGKSSSGYSGDGGAATNASLYRPSGVALDAYGNLYIADYNNNRIRRVDTSGIITTVAGKSSSGYSGEGGAATNASLYYPYGVALDAYGNLYIADLDNNRIRRVDTSGIITTVAGKSSSGYSGDGGAATNASLYYPYGVALDAYGNLYIADYNNSRIRRVDTSGFITTVAGKSSSGYSGDGGAATNASLYHPSGVALDAYGNLYIADYSNKRIRKVLLYAGYPTFTLNNIGVVNAGNYTVIITSPYGSVTSTVAPLTVAAPAAITIQPANQIVATGSSASFSVAVAGSGPFDYEWYFSGTSLVQSGTNSTLTLPGVSTNNTGNYTVMITNTYGYVTSRVATLTVALPPTVAIQPASQTNLAGTTVSFSVAAAGIGPFTYQWQFNGSNFPNNIITTVAGSASYGFSGDGGAATNARLVFPTGVAFDTSGNLHIADWYNNRIRKVDSNGIITTVAGNGSANYAGDGGAATNASFNGSTRVACDANVNLYIADQYNNRIRKVNTNGIITTVVGNGTQTYAGDGGPALTSSLYSPCGITFDASGNLYIADEGNNCIRKVDTTGIITTVAGTGTNGYSGDGGAAITASLATPDGVSCDAFGNLYIADTGNSRIRKVDTHGTITSMPVGTVYSPQGVACDAFGELYFEDYGNSRIRKVGTNGIITIVAGNGTRGFSGDGGAATNASLIDATGLAFDASGNLFIADFQNFRVREVHFAGYPTFTLTNVNAINAGNYTVVITSPYGSVTSSVVTLSIPAYIISQPQPRTAPVGGSATFSVTAGGTAPLNYQWWMTASPQSNATAVPVVYYGFVVSASVTSGGAGYLSVPQVQVLGGSGNGAGGYAVVSNRMVTSIIMTNAGFGYSTSPTIQIDAPSAISLLGQTNATLTLFGVTTDNAANYFVVVTNNYGGVTSAVATLTVTIPPPQIIAGGTNFGFTTNGSGFGFNLSGTVGQTVVVDGSTNLLNWTPLFTNTVGTNSVYFFDPTSTNFPGRFYRARLP
jgi:sugar lactone lactonase YvrE